MLPNDGSPARLRDILEKVTRSSGIDADVGGARVWSAWEDIVGADIAEHAEPTSLRRGVLRVRTDSPVWATELAYLSEEIRRRVNDALEKEVVATVKIWTAPGRVVRRSKPPSSVTKVSPRAERAEDPMVALARARSAWARARGGASGGSDDRRGTRGRSP